MIHTFAGEYALGGTRHPRAAFRTWLGRLVELHITLETQHLTDTLDRMVAAGIEEAVADLIEGT